uniref:Cysteine-rich and transmembrane domain-containing protein 1-like n=1 Tax=Saccoglossus kowalevskii TaxID=10224 RepID=A0ABM0GXZ7_SACKO|nr:PREDICTED: cysteine-rich and transmembrane domain-containing protein 1-like [Saccoglossus kowalevskii]
MSYDQQQPPPPYSTGQPQPAPYGYVQPQPAMPPPQAGPYPQQGYMQQPGAQYTVVYGVPQEPKTTYVIDRTGEQKKDDGKGSAFCLGALCTALLCCCMN